MESTNNQIIEKIKRSARGTIFFTSDFFTFSNEKTIQKGLERLVRKGILYRPATGMYIRPMVDIELGPMMPGIEEIALAIARRDRARTVPTGSYALFVLGLSSQVPTNIVYYTDASPRRVRVGKLTITFKKASAKTLAAEGKTSRLVIQAMRTIGKEKITAEEIIKLKTLLANEKPQTLKNDLTVAPAWIRRLLS